MSATAEVPLGPRSDLGVSVAGPVNHGLATWRGFRNGGLDRACYLGDTPSRPQKARAAGASESERPKRPQVRRRCVIRGANCAFRFWVAAARGLHARWHRSDALAFAMFACLSARYRSAIFYTANPNPAANRTANMTRRNTMSFTLPNSAMPSAVPAASAGSVKASSVTTFEGKP